MERYATWVQRSKAGRLDISINDKPFEDSPVENIEAIMELIGPQMERWRSLQIDKVSFQNICIVLDHFKDCSLPQLEILRIVESSREFHRNLPPRSLGELALDAPQLKEVELAGVVADFDSTLFHNLHVLRLKDGSLTELTLPAAKDLIHKLLRKSPHLKQLRIGDLRSLITPLPLATQPPPLVNEEPFSHPSLLDLTLGFRNGVLDALIPSIKFPALRSFRSARRPRLMLKSWHLTVLIRNSPFHSLEEIQLAGNSGDRQHDRYLAEALTTLPSLTWLQLEYFNISQVTDAILALGHLCPRLQALRIVWCTGVDLNLVRSLVNMRLGAQGITKLRELIVRGRIGGASKELSATKTWLEERVERVTLETDPLETAHRSLMLFLEP
ncbi:hypothetical protein FRC00_004697 [Tulasnella sp. 408]|nr:hypothetical protein FRC00_004697 [Tulasnella sp. 408]